MRPYPPWIQKAGRAVHLGNVREDNRFVAFTGFWPRGDAYWEDLGQVCKGRRIAIVWDGSQPTAVYLFDRAPKFDLYVPELAGGDPEPGVMIVPRSMILEKFASGFDQLRKAIAGLEERGAASIALVGTPPPKGDPAAVRGLLTAEPYYGEMAKELGMDLDEVELTAPIILLKIWRIIQDRYAEIAREQGIAYVTVPDQALTGPGFLAPEYWSNDVGHANLEYGNLMRGEIARHFGQG